MTGVWSILSGLFLLCSIGAAFDGSLWVGFLLGLGCLACVWFAVMSLEAPADDDLDTPV